MMGMEIEPGLFRALTEGGLCHQIKCIQAMPPVEGKITAAVLFRLRPQAPWAFRGEQLDTVGEVFLYFDTLIDMHLENYPGDRHILMPWKQDLQRYLHAPENGLTEMANGIA